MTKKYAIFLTALFLTFIGAFFVANAVSPDKDFSPTENRTLAQMPTFSLESVKSGEFMSGFEDYVTDQFALRDKWIALKAGTEVALGKRENNGVYLCDEDTLMFRFDFLNTDRAIKRMNQNFALVDTFAEKTDVPVYFSLIPGKVSVWADRLPVDAPNEDEGQFLLKGAESKANWVDVNTTLMAHKDEDIYYRTDHHWTTLGAYYAYAALVERMGMTPKALNEFNATIASEEFFGTIYSSSGVRWVKPDTITFYVPQEAAEVTNYYDSNPTVGQLYDLSKLEEKDKYSTFLGGNKPLTIVKSNVCASDAPKLLLVRDSFADSIAPFLCYNFSEIHLVDPRYYKVSMSQYIEENDIDMALVMYSVSNFVEDANLFVLGL